VPEPAGLRREPHPVRPGPGPEIGGAHPAALQPDPHLARARPGRPRPRPPAPARVPRAPRPAWSSSPLRRPRRSAPAVETRPGRAGSHPWRRRRAGAIPFLPEGLPAILRRRVSLLLRHRAAISRAAP
jgi:hypothetical protein